MLNIKKIVAFALIYGIPYWKTYWPIVRRAGSSLILALHVRWKTILLGGHTPPSGKTKTGGETHQLKRRTLSYEKDCSVYNARDAPAPPKRRHPKQDLLVDEKDKPKE